MQKSNTIIISVVLITLNIINLFLLLICGNKESPLRKVKANDIKLVVCKFENLNLQKSNSVDVFNLRANCIDSFLKEVNSLIENSVVAPPFDWAAGNGGITIYFKNGEKAFVSFTADKNLIMVMNEPIAIPFTKEAFIKKLYLMRQ